MAEIFDKMKVEFVDQDESVQVVANNIRDTGEVPERYVRYEIKAEPIDLQTGRPARARFGTARHYQAR
jgi:hypothetical protein